MSKKMLIAGPWVGEFGWELFCWQGVVRKASKDYDAICIIARPGKQAMYIDILDDFGNLGMYHEYHCGSNLTNAWKIEGDVPNPFDVQDFLNTEKIQNFIKENEITEVGLIDGRRDYQEQEGIYYDYSRYEPDTECKLIIHARNKETGSDRNWPEENYKSLVELIEANTSFSRDDIAFIGAPDSFFVEGCVDKRGQSLDKDFSTLRGCEVVIGPSSGPMHLASLAKAKHLVWGATVPTDLLQRYNTYWNPFQTPCIFIEDNSWKVNPHKVFHHFMSRDTLYHTQETKEESLVEFCPRNNYHINSRMTV